MTVVIATPTHFIGCDVGSATIVVFDSRTGQIRIIPNRPADLARFVATLDDTSLVICEATGGHEDALLKALLKAGRAAHCADARKVKAFIRSFGTRGKTDAIDARALAAYGQERHATLARWQVPDPQRERLQTLVLTRREIAALAGQAPHPNQSGTGDAYRRTRGGGRRSNACCSWRQWSQPSMTQNSAVSTSTCCRRAKSRSWP